MVLKLKKRLNRGRDEKGQILIFVLVVMLFGAFVIGPLLAYVNTSLVLSKRTLDDTTAYYAADAGVAWAIANLVKGQVDPVDYIMDSATINFNGQDVYIWCNATSGAPPPLLTPNTYLNPFNTAHGAIIPVGTDPYALAPDKYWLFQVYTPGGGSIRIHWVFTHGGSYDCWLQLYEGKHSSWPPSPPETPVDELLQVGNEDPAYLELVYSVPPDESGWYTVVFYNVPGSTTVTSQPFIGGHEEYTWVRVQGYQDYLITSTAGDTTVTAYVRQTPGPSKYWMAQEISVFSWQID